MTTYSSRIDLKDAPVEASNRWLASLAAGATALAIAANIALLLMIGAGMVSL